ncbi:MAG: preprotein translocase subunit YajC [Thermoleophilia bacterium]|nr:preprotein translocase subunit YajC [Thermoleophilia bacterium]
MTFVIVMLAMLVFMYFLLIRPQKAKQRAAQELLNRLAPGDEVVTIGGIYGDVVEVDDAKVVLEIAEDVHIEVARRAIASIVPPETESESEAEGEELAGDEEPEADAEAEAGEQDAETADAGEAGVEVEERAR